MIKKIFFSLLFLAFTNSSFSQNTALISGYLKGLGTGKKVYLGNKPKGIGANFIEFFFDSTYSINDSFCFKKIKFTYVTDYSVETESHKGWQSFLIDNGKIFISGHVDTIYRSKVIGSGNETLYKKFYNDIYKPWSAKYTAMMNRLPSKKNLDSIRYNRINDSMIEITEDHRNQIYKFYIQNVKQKPYASFRILRMATMEIMPDSILQKFYSMLTKSVKNSFPLKDVRYRLNGYKQNVVVGKKVPDFSFFNPALKKTSLNDLDGQYKLIVFWASWCVPCLAEIPILDSLQKLYDFMGLKIYPVNIDNEKSLWKKSLNKYNFSCTHLSQLSGNKSPLFKYFAFSTIPNAILLDRDNKILLFGPDINKYFYFLEEIKK